MDKAHLDGMYGYFRMVLGMSRKLLEQFPEESIHLRPREGMRTAAEIVAHNYAFLGDALEIVTKGTMVQSEEPKLATKAEMLAFADRQVAKLFDLHGRVTEAQLPVVIEAWGTKFPAWQFAVFAYDEHWHHRGQLTVYLRLAGVTPLMIYDYESLKVTSA